MNLHNQAILAAKWDDEWRNESEEKKRKTAKISKRITSTRRNETQNASVSDGDTMRLQRSWTNKKMKEIRKVGELDVEVWMDEYYKSVHLYSILLMFIRLLTSGISMSPLSTI